MPERGGRRRQPGEPSRSRVKLRPADVCAAVRRALVRSGRAGPAGLGLATQAVARAAGARVGMTWPWFRATVTWRGPGKLDARCPQDWPAALVRLVYDPTPDLNGVVQLTAAAEEGHRGTCDA